MVYQGDGYSISLRRCSIVYKLVVIAKMVSLLSFSVCFLDTRDLDPSPFEQIYQFADATRESADVNGGESELLD